jgi:hypothetical protein
VDSPYYSESELFGGAVTVSFFEIPPLASGVLPTTLHDDSGTGGFDLSITSKFLAWELPLRGWKSSEIAWGEIWTVWRMF